MPLPTLTYTIQAMLSESQASIKKGHIPIQVLPGPNAYTTYKQTAGLTGYLDVLSIFFGVVVWLSLVLWIKLIKITNLKALKFLYYFWPEQHIGDPWT